MLPWWTERNFLELARLYLSLLYLPFDSGGLECSDPLWYDWEARLRIATFYFSDRSSYFAFPSVLLNPAMKNPPPKNKRWGVLTHSRACLSHASVQYGATTDSQQAELTCTLTRELKMSKDNRGSLGIRKQDLNLIWRVDGQISRTNIFLTSSKGKHLKIDLPPVI